MTETRAARRKRLRLGRLPKHLQPKVKGTAKYMGGSRVKYIWPCGHYRIETFTSGSRPVSPVLTAKFARYWGDGRRGHIWLSACETCERRTGGLTDTP